MRGPILSQSTPETTHSRTSNAGCWFEWGNGSHLGLRSLDSTLRGQAFDLVAIPLTGSEQISDRAWQDILPATAPFGQVWVAIDDLSPRSEGERSTPVTCTCRPGIHTLCTCGHESRCPGEAWCDAGHAREHSDARRSQ